MSVNKWIGIGNLTKDPELRYTASGTAVCNFSIACNERFKDRDGNQQEKVEYVNISCWRQLAEICGKYLVKGKQIYIEGKLQTRKWEDRDGNTRYTTEIVANEMQMLGSKGEGQAPQQDCPTQSQQGPSGSIDNNQFNPDDDIPF
jgi:single-strand DNA-binding protein